MKATFKGKKYEVVFTDHAKLQMALRHLAAQDILNVIESGQVKAKNTENKFWIFKELRGRKDNLVSVSISIEDPNLIVITTMVSWRPQ
jgi:hypothetical protein